MTPDSLILAAQSQAHAAWLQAIGSLLALIVAIGIPLRVSSRVRAAKAAEARLVARDHALSLITPLRDWAERWCIARTALHAGGETQERLAIMEAVNFNVRVMPDELTQLRGRLHALGTAAEPLQTLCFRYDKMTADAEKMERWRLGDYADPEEDQTWRRQHVVTIRAFLAALDESVTKLTELLA